MPVRGKPGALYTYGRLGERVPVRNHIASRRELRQAKWTEVEVPADVQREWQVAERRKAAANLEALVKPLKPPRRRVEV